jgi:pyruvate dehydrogenase E1 component
VDVEGIVKGMYVLREAVGVPDGVPRAQLLASGVGVPWALEASDLLQHDYDVAADVWSVTSWNELRREALEAEAPTLRGGVARLPYVTMRLAGRPGPVVAVSDFMRAVQDQIAPWVPQQFTSLGTDGFGFSDTRAAARRWLRIDGPSIVVKTLEILERRGEIGQGAARDAYLRYGMDTVPVTHAAVAEEE